MGDEIKKHELEDRWVEIIQSEEQVKKRLVKTQNFGDLESCIKRSNLCVNRKGERE